MTDRHAGYLVTLEKDIREDDAEDTLTALRQVRGVISVRPIVSGYELAIAQERERLDIVKKLSVVMQAILKGKTVDIL